MAYLFVHFIGEQKDGEQIYFSVSEDGLHWNDLHEGKPVLKSDIGEKGVRDPFLVRDEKNGIFYLIATDLRIEAGKGWTAASSEGSRDIIVWESKDLVNWSAPRACTVGIEGAGCVWAPECIYDREREEFFVFWASMVKLPGDEEAKQRIYGCYTKDFRGFGEAFLYMEMPNHVIDMNIIEANGWYYRFVKDETTKVIRLDRVKHLQDKDAELIHAETLAGLYGVEGPECYRLPDGRFCLIVDQFAKGKGYLPVFTNYTASGNFEIAAPGR